MMDSDVTLRDGRVVHVRARCSRGRYRIVDLTQGKMNEFGGKGPKSCLQSTGVAELRAKE